MPVITLPDGSQRQFHRPVTILNIARDIGPGLAKATLAAKVGGKLVDANHVIDSDSVVRILTDKDTEGLEVIRHSCAHLMAHAVKELFPAAQVTIGPVIEDGFYYDFACKRAFTPDDLIAIEKKMQTLADQDLPVKRQIMNRDQAITYFRGMGEDYKAKIIESIAADAVLSLYQQGNFIDLCRGPHVPSTGKLRAFKLTKLAGAYWRGDSQNEMLQRIYGTAWADKKALKQYLVRLEEAEKRDHRKIAKKLNLFHFQEEAPGMVFWHPRGWTIYQIIEQYIREKMNHNGYCEIRTPEIVDKSLWERSGHWGIFQRNMFTTSSENRDYAIKPMNCPCHVQVFNRGLRSYRDLPLRLSEFGSCHRNEPSGTLHGLMRARNFIQDDAHIFCTRAQIQSEVALFIDLLYRVYADFGFSEIQVNLSTRPGQRVGDDVIWDEAEQALELALNAKGLAWESQPGEGAFYGPKIDFALKDCIGRIWQCGTVQVDFSMPGRLGASYIDENSQKQVPVMIHRAILGSIERFIGILIEHYAGSLPVWLAPIQVIVASIADNQADYTRNVTESLKCQGIRVESDLRNETISLKIREHAIHRVPYLVILGAKEAAGNTMAVRTRGGKDLGGMILADFIARLHSDIEQRS